MEWIEWCLYLCIALCPRCSEKTPRPCLFPTILHSQTHHPSGPTPVVPQNQSLLPPNLPAYCIRNRNSVSSLLHGVALLPPLLRPEFALLLYIPLPSPPSGVPVY